MLIQQSEQMEEIRFQIPPTSSSYTIFDNNQYRIVMEQINNAASLEGYDPMISILGAFEAIPVEHLDSMFIDFTRAGESRNLRTLLDTIADWSATADIYSKPALSQSLIGATAGRQETAEWLRGL